MHLPANPKLFYGGAWHEPHGGYAPTMDPATNIPLADAPLADASDVENCVQAARQAFPHWRSTTPEARCEALRKAARILRENIPALALLDSANNGNPVSFIARNLEYAIALVEYFATLALVLGSNLPDIDVLWSLRGTASYLKFHRGITHSFLGVTVLAGLLAATLHYFARRTASRKNAPPLDDAWLFAIC